MGRGLGTVLREALSAALTRALPCASPYLVTRRRSSPAHALKRARAAGAVLSLLPLFAALQLLACATNRYLRPEPGAVQRGAASWYGPEFHGRFTASGEIYDMNGLSAAHRDLPLGTVVEVENLDNGRRVTLRINDRGPFVRGRILDVSYGAALALEMVGPGVVPVEIRVVSVGTPDLPRQLPAAFDAWTVQVGAFRDRERAEALRGELAAADFADVELRSGGDDLTRVQVGRFGDRRKAEDLRRRLARRGWAAIVVAITG